MKILIDDMRDSLGIDVIARTYEAGFTLLNALGNQCELPTCDLLMDHDLGNEDDNKNGYDLMCLLENAVLGEGKMGFLPKSIRCVSDNPVGAARIRQVINKLYKGA